MVKDLRFEKLRPSVSSTDADGTACSNIVFRFCIEFVFCLSNNYTKYDSSKASASPIAMVKWPVVTRLFKPSNFVESINRTKFIYFRFVLIACFCGCYLISAIPVRRLENLVKKKKLFTSYFRRCATIKINKII